MRRGVTEARGSSLLRKSPLLLGSGGDVMHTFQVTGVVQKRNQTQSAPPKSARSGTQQARSKCSLRRRNGRTRPPLWGLEC